MKSILKKSTCCLLIAMFLITSFSTTTFAANYSTGYYACNYETMNVRSGPSLNNSVIGVLKKGEQIYIHNIIYANDGKVWGAFSFNGSVAYARMDGGYLSFLFSETTSKSGYYKVAYESMNIRSGPGLNYSVVGTLYKNNIVYVEDTAVINGIEWALIDYGPHGAYARISGGYLIPVK